MPRSDGPFKIVEKVNDNALKLEPPGEYGLSVTFNVGEFVTYVHDDDMAHLRSIVFG